MTTIVTRAGKGSPLTHTEVDTNFTNLNTNKLEAGAIALGSAATPSISFTGDTNTGIFSPGADQLAISTNGTGRLFVNANGQVGIGLGSPNRALVVRSADAEQLVLTSTAGSFAGIFFNPNGSAYTPFFGATGESLVAQTSGNERLRITSAGLVGIGTSSPSSALDVSGAISLGAVALPSAGTARIFSRNTDSNLYIQTGSGNTLNFLDGSQNTMASFGSSTVTLQTGNSPRLSIDSSGRVGIGITGPQAPLHVRATAGAANDRGILIQDTTTGNAGEAWLSFKPQESTDEERVKGAIVYANAGSSYGRGNLLFLLDSVEDNGSATTSDEKMRITYDGKLLVGTSSGTYKLQVEASSQVGYFHHTGSSDTIGMILRHGRGLSGFTGKMVSMQRNDGTEVGSIVIGESSTAYNTSSDYRLKENVVNLDNAIDRLNLLAVCRFNFIDNPERIVDGFIAHEVQEVVPEAITGEKDAVDTDGNPIYQGIDQSKLVPLLTAALQEAIGRIETLEAEVAALKAQ